MFGRIVERYYDFLVTNQAERSERNFLGQILKHKRDIFVPKISSITEYLKNLEKPIIEIGGPTPLGYKQVQTDFLDHFFVSNLAGPDQKAVGNQDGKNSWLNHVGSSGTTNIQLDGRNMPFAAGSLAGILMKAIVQDEKMNQEIIAEAKRVLIVGGLLVMEQNNPHLVAQALESDFEIVSADISLQTVLKPYWNVVLRKK